MNKVFLNKIIELDRCPGTLSKGYKGYSSTCIKKVFGNKKVSPFLNYQSPSSNDVSDELFDDNRRRISIARFRFAGTIPKSSSAA